MSPKTGRAAALTAALLAAAAASAATATPAAAASNPLADYAWKRRVLLVSAASADDAGLVAQRRIFVAMQEGARERDLSLVEAVGDGAKARALRARFDIPAPGFRALLIGKDGGEKLAATSPLGPEQLFPVIDAMPMRRDEMGRSR